MEVDLGSAEARKGNARFEGLVGSEISRHFVFVGLTFY